MIPVINSRNLLDAQYENLESIVSKLQGILSTSNNSDKFVDETNRLYLCFTQAVADLYTYLQELDTAMSGTMGKYWETNPSPWAKPEEDGL